jgi:hypothetical protein
VSKISKKIQRFQFWENQAPRRQPGYPDPVPASVDIGLLSTLHTRMVWLPSRPRHLRHVFLAKIGIAAKGSRALTLRITIVTRKYMKILMDADCLIKLTKAGLKEAICPFCAIMMPQAVYREVVDAGKRKRCEDAFVVEKNISDGKIGVIAPTNTQ